VLYNRGMLSAMLTIESIRTAQKKFGNRVVTGDEVRWGAEHLNLDAARIKALGVEGMMQPVHTSCMDHGGVHSARIHTWDGGEWSYTSEMYQSESKMLAPIIKSSAEKYASDKKLPIVDCAKES
jgi:branched-chain amino acid transport system substrate-binding protein